MNSLRVRLLAALLGVGVLAFMAALASALWVTRDRIEAQMASQAQSIALSLTVALTATGEPALQNAESLVEPIFDQSYLRRIAVRDTQQRIVASREAPARLNGGAPQWFAELLPLAVGVRSADIMQGWRIAGSVLVEPHAHWAHLQLWEVARSLLFWMGSGLAATCLLGLAALRWGLRPLRSVQRSAVAAASRRFTPIDASRMPAELQPLIGAFNRMLGALAQALDAESERAARFRDQALVDELTGLSNRRGVRAALEARIETGPHDGWLALLRADGLENLNHRFGRPAVDSLLAASARLIREEVGEGVCGRIEGACFALLIDAPEETARGCLAGLLTRLDGLAQAAAGDASLRPWRGGAAGCGHDTDVARWLAVADQALQRWQTGGAPGFVRIAGQGGEVAEPVRQQGGKSVSEPVSKSAGAPVDGVVRASARGPVRELVRHGRFVFASQATCVLEAAGAGSPMHVELRAMLDAGDRLIRAAEYMSDVGEARMSAALDGVCLMRALEHAQARRDGVATVVNVGAATLTDPDILRWVAGYRHDARRGGLILEFSESVLLGNPDAAEALAGQAQARGLALGIKHFGLHASALSLLRRLRPQHVKFSAALTREALRHPDSGAYVASLTGIAAALSITSVAVAVEQADTLPALHALGFRAVQGNAVSPESLPRR